MSKFDFEIENREKWAESIRRRKNHNNIDVLSELRVAKLHLNFKALIDCVSIHIEHIGNPITYIWMWE